MKTRINLCTTFTWLLVTVIASALQAQTIITPRVGSPGATVTQTIGISTVTVNYSRPKVNDREIWGKLVPYGWNVQGFGLGNSAPWRAGANENTIIQFSHPAKVEGQSIPAGSYGLFFVINEDNTGEVILSKDYQAWGSFFYDKSRDQLRAKIQLRSNAHTELLTYDFINNTKSSSELVLNWEKKQFPVKVEFATDEIVMANAEAMLKGAARFNPQSFITASNYALQNNLYLDKAVVWIDQAIAQNRNFPALNLKSQLLSKSGKTEEGAKLLAEAIAGATEVELNAYGYQLINQGKHDKAIEVFLLNTQRNPKSANAWDSLGEGYALKGDKTNAVKCFKKCLSLNPPANVRANSEKYLTQLGTS